MSGFDSSINLVTGGAGFLGSHLVDQLLKKGEKVICVDNYSTGSKVNIEHWIGHPKFELITHDIIKPIHIEVSKIWHLACPASPIHYQYDPIKTSKTCFMGTLNMLGLAKRNNARMLLASSSEIYGDPQQHPQREVYRGNVNPIGIRSCYNEGKRISESLCFAYMRQNNINVKVMRIFNTYGPRMFPNDGRVVSNFILKALNNDPLSIYGNGSQTRSFCYVEDLINGMIKVMDGNIFGPVNLGNHEEISILDLAKKIKIEINGEMDCIFKDLPFDDPTRRQPSIALAKNIYQWEPRISLEKGLKPTIIYFKKLLKKMK